MNNAGSNTLTVTVERVRALTVTNVLELAIQPAELSLAPGAAGRVIVTASATPGVLRGCPPGMAR